jgi:hypothetical protein
MKPPNEAQTVPEIIQLLADLFGTAPTKVVASNLRWRVRLPWVLHFLPVAL